MTSYPAGALPSRCFVLWVAFIAVCAAACSAACGPRHRATRLQARVRINVEIKHQTIEGFGSTASPQHGAEPWFQELYYRDLRASILRVDLTPTFRAPYSDFAYNSPWFHGSPALPGPDGNNARTYHDQSDYVRAFAGRSAAIAVMGPDIERNIQLFDFGASEVQARGLLAQRGEAERAQLAGFKLIGSVWSPAPWLKQTTGSKVREVSPMGPKARTPFPFIWNGNFSGGKLDTSGTPQPAFDDRAFGGTGPTSALTQFARGLAAYVLGFQRTFKTRFYAISIQNELGFETYYHSCVYESAVEYAAALKAVRTELDKHSDLKDIRILGPEDLLGETYGLWSLGSAEHQVTKNLGFLNALFADETTRDLIDIACVHGYAPDGVTAAGADASQWRRWAYGWNESPAPGMPTRARGFRDLVAQSWMTESSGETHTWLSAKGVFPTDAAFGLALKIHQALTSGEESAWLYWQLAYNNKLDANSLTDRVLRDKGPKYVAAKHFFRFIRPGARRVDTQVTGARAISASSYVHAALGTLTIVILNASEQDAELMLDVPPAYAKGPIAMVRSDEEHIMQASTAVARKGQVKLVLPAWGIATLVGRSR